MQGLESVRIYSNMVRFHNVTTFYDIKCEKIMINSILFSQTNSLYIYQIPNKQGNCSIHNSSGQLVYHPIREVSVCPKNKQKTPHTGNTESLDRCGQYGHCHEEKKNLIWEPKKQYIHIYIYFFKGSTIFFRGGPKKTFVRGSHFFFVKKM